MDLIIYTFHRASIDLIMYTCFRHSIYLIILKCHRASFSIVIIIKRNLSIVYEDWPLNIVKLF